MNQTIYDAVIIGGGPSGSTAATDLALAGHSVLLIERGGRIKPCGGAIPPRLLADFDIPQSLLVAKARSARMIAPSGRAVDMPVGEIGYVGMVDREEFDEALRERARHSGAEAARCGIEALITDDHLAVEDAIAAAAPELVLGTQMERHIAKRLGIPCAVISAPVHVQDFPARHSPQMGFEGANVIFDTWVHPLVMGLEEHLLTMFREDFEFSDEAGASHHAAILPHRGRGATPDPIRVGGEAPAAFADLAPSDQPGVPLHHLADSPPSLAGEDRLWTAEAERELKKIPFFVRGKARRNTENFAAAEGRRQIDLETLYDAKAHYAR